VDKFTKFELSHKKTFETLTQEVQAEGDFGSRQIFAGCFASAIEFGPQPVTDKNTTRPAFKFSIRLNPGSNKIL
jgi:hypothetical protein